MRVLDYAMKIHEDCNDDDVIGIRFNRFQLMDKEIQQLLDESICCSFYDFISDKIVLWIKHPKYRIEAELYFLLYNRYRIIDYDVR